VISVGNTGMKISMHMIRFGQVTHTFDGLHANIPQFARARVTEHVFKIILIDALPLANLPTIAAGRTKTNALRLKDAHRISALGQMQRS
jgi:hypothetical protein